MSKILLCTISLALLSSISSVVVATENHDAIKISLTECRRCIKDCTAADLEGIQTYNLGKPINKRILSFSTPETESKGISYSLFLSDSSSCRHVLSTESSGGIEFLDRRDSPFPDIAAHWSMGASSAIYWFYSWNSDKYVEATRQVAAAMNKEAVQLIKHGEIEKAVGILEIASEADKADAEIMNNYGYSRYILAKLVDKDINNKEARIWLEKSLRADPNRWSAYLNLGDLFYDNNDFMYALYYYKKLLEIKPAYKFAKKIKAKIAGLILQPLEPGDTTSLSTDISMSKVVYTKLKDGRAVRREYFEWGQLYTEHNLKNGFPDGAYVAYWSGAGGIRVKGQFSRGVRTGKFTYYDEHGKVIKEVNYDEKKVSTKLDEDWSYPPL